MPTWWVAAILSIALLPLPQVSITADLTLNNIPIKVCFSPKGGCTEAITHEIDQAKSEILVQAYSFTSAPIAKALLDAHKRGLIVQIILDKSR